MPRVEATYPYVDESGRVLFAVERIVPKGFRQFYTDDSGTKVYHLNGIRRVLYHLPEVIAAVRDQRLVVVVEGEKDADTLMARGVVATTPPGGAGKWRSEYNDFLRGAKVWIVSDADEVGRKHALSVACELDHVAAKLDIFEPMAPHKDVTAHIAAGLSARDLRPFDRAAVQASLVPKNARKRAGVISARDFCARPGLNGSLQVLGPAVNRTMRCTIGAATGDGKTTIGCQMIRAIVCKEPFLKDEWRGKGGRALVVDVEQGEETVKQRLRDVGLDDNPNVDLLWEPDGLALDSDPDDRGYVERVLAEGRYDVALFDPLYQLHHGDQNSERTAADVMRIMDEWGRRYGLAIIVPMHRRKPHPQAGLGSFTINDIGGNGAWVRNSEIVLGLQVVRPGRSRLHFFKDRPGYLPGVGTSMDLTFDRGTHLFGLADEEEPHGWKATKAALAAMPEPPTTQELADQFGVQPEAIRRHMRQIKASCDDESKPLAERRWSLKPWPAREMSLLEGAAGD